MSACEKRTFDIDQKATSQTRLSLPGAFPFFNGFGADVAEEELMFETGVKVTETSFEGNVDASPVAT